MACRISELVIDATDPGRLAAFWSHVLGYVERGREDDGSIEIGPPEAGFGGLQPRQPAAQVLPVGRGDLAPLHLPGHGVEVVEGQLLPVNIQSAYDGHRDLLKLPRAPQAPVRIAYESIVTRLS